MRRYPPTKTGPHTGWSPNRDRAAQARFRAALIIRSGGWCEWPDCPNPGDQAHHDKAGYTPDCGRYLCRQHHKQADPYAR